MKTKTLSEKVKRVRELIDGEEWHLFEEIIKELQEELAISYDANARLKKENEAPTQPKSDLPKVGSRWRDKKDHDYQLTVQEGICFTDNTSNLSYDLGVEDFLNDYEPIPTQSDNEE